MSISPTDIQRSGSPSSSLHFQQNPSSDHGFQDVRDPLDLRIGSLSLRETPARPAGSAAGPPPESIAGGAGDTSGFEQAAVGIFGDSRGSSKNVAEFRSQDLYDQSSVLCSQGRASAQGGISSQFRSDQNQPQIKGDLYGTDKILHSDHLGTSSVGFQGSASQSASRRSQVVSANHLLNFQYDPISRPPPRAPPPRRQRKIKPYNKDLFLQANYKFVVLDTGSNLVESTDPDKMLQWEDVVCVRYSTPFPVQCPICLESPLCPQITSCGHIYCFPCILQYLLMGKEDHRGDCWKKCPICSMMLSPKDLYTIHIDNVKQYRVGDCASFALLTRPKDSLFPSLKSQQGIDLAPCDRDSISDSFSKFIFTSDVELSIEEAKSDLNNWLYNAELGLADDLERLPYVCAALAQLEERVKNWTDNRNFNGSPPLRNSVSHSSTLKDTQASSKADPNSSNSISYANSNKLDAREPAGVIPHHSQNHERFELSSNVDCESSSAAVASVSLGSPDKVIISSDDDKCIQQNSSSCKDAREKDAYVFYQAIDGQHLILHPLNMKCLLNHYGSYDMLPPRICGEILELETVTQSEAMRRRYRYLSHFSLTTTFQLCEIDLSKILPPSSLFPFMDEIKKRERQRKRVARKEQVEKDRAEAAVAAAAAVHVVHNIPSDQRHSPHRDKIFSSEDFAVLGSGVVPSTSPPISSERKLFSDVTRLGFAAAHDSPSLRPEGSANSLGITERMGEASNSQGMKPISTLSFASIMSSANTTGSPVMQNSSGVGKKGKKPNRVLMSTAGGRRY